MYRRFPNLLYHNTCAVPSMKNPWPYSKTTMQTEGLKGRHMIAQGNALGMVA